MATYISNRDGLGKTDEEGHYRLINKVLTGNVANNGFQVTQDTGSNMNIIISAGDIRIPYQDYAYNGWSDSNVTLTDIAFASTGTRMDLVVAYVDLSVTSTATDVNNPNALKFAIVNGNVASPIQAPSASMIGAVIGISNPYVVLAQIACPVAASGVYITNSIITNVQVPIGINISDTSSSQDNPWPSVWSNGILSGFSVTPGTGLGLIVGQVGVPNYAIGASSSGINSTLFMSGIQTYAATATAPLTSGQSQVTSIVVCYDTGAANATGATVIMSVPGTAATTGSQVAPTTTQIRNYLSDGNLMIMAVIANVTVAYGATAITTANITTVNVAKIPASAVDFTVGRKLYSCGSASSNSTVVKNARQYHHINYHIISAGTNGNGSWASIGASNRTFTTWIDETGMDNSTSNFTTQETITGSDISIARISRGGACGVGVIDMTVYPTGGTNYLAIWHSAVSGSPTFIVGSTQFAVTGNDLDIHPIGNPTSWSETIEPISI